MGALLQRLLPAMAGDHARHMGRVEQHQRADLVGNGADLADRMREQVEAAADRDQLRPQAQRILPQPLEIDRVVDRIDRSRMADDAVKPGRARAVMGDMAADLAGRRDDAVAGTWPPP